MATNQPRPNQDKQNPQSPARPPSDTDNLPEALASESDFELLDRIVAHFTAALRSGSYPAIADYQKRFPKLSEEIEEMLSSVAMIEQLKGESEDQPAPNNKKLFDKVSGLTRIGKYNLVREVGRGGMGIVFQAVHESLGRQVAIKIMPTPLTNAEKYIERFKREAQSAAKLHHTNIVSVFGVGEDEGFHFYVMDFVKGQSLSELVYGLNLTKSNQAEASHKSRQTGSNQTDSSQSRGDLSKLGKPDSNPSIKHTSAPTALEISTESTRAEISNPHSDDSFDLAIPQGDVCDENQIESSGSLGEQASGGFSSSNDFSPSSGFSPSKLSQNSGTYRQEIPTQAGTNSDNPKYFRWAARIGASISDALAYAHSNKILHRDIKPSNMMLDERGVVWVTDFGLAKDNSSDMNLTQTGDVIGTPQYLAPESLEGKYDQRSETYCVGLTLYELGTLQPAYAPGATAEVIRAIATTTPTSPRKLNRRIPIDLSTIIDKAVSRDPHLRYQKPEDLRNDLLAFVEDRPISARPPMFFESAIRWARRNPLPATLSALSAILLAMVAVVASIGYLYTTDALNKSKQEQQLTLNAKKEADRNLANMKIQFNRAEENVGLTIDAFDEMFKQVIARGAATNDELDIDGFRDVAGIETSITKEDAAFLNKLLTFYEKFVSLNANNERLKSESAKAFRRVGNIHQLVGELKPAVEAYEKSVELYQSIWESAQKQNPSAHLENKVHLLTLVQTRNEFSTASRKSRLPRTADLNRETLQLLEDSPLSKTDPDTRLEVARTLTLMGFDLARIVSVANQQGGGRNPMSPPRRMGDFFRGGRMPGAGEFGNRGGGRPSPDGSRPLSRNDRRNVQYMERAIGIIDDLIEASPHNEEYLAVRATCYCTTAVVRMQTGQTEEGISLRDKAITEFESLVTEIPTNAEYRYLLAIALTIGSSAPELEDAQLLERSDSIVDSLIDQFPNLLDYYQLQVSLKIKLAKIHLDDGKLNRSLGDLMAATNSLKFLADATKLDRAYMRSVGPLTGTARLLAREFDKNDKPEKLEETRLLIKQINTMRPPGRPADGRFGRGPKDLKGKLGPN